MARQRRRITVVNDMSDIPDFDTEDEEVAFWDTHELAPNMLASADEAATVRAVLPPPRAESVAEPRTRPVSVRFDGNTMRRLKALAAKKGTGYQTLLKEFVVERLYEEEKREGI